MAPMNSILTDTLSSAPEEEIRETLERRLGHFHARQRLGIERDHESVFGHGINFFHIENWYSIHALFRIALKITGLYWRGQENSAQIQVRHNRIQLCNLPSSFDGFTILHISDLHADMNPRAMERLADVLPGLDYDICVLTGDYRGETYGPFDKALERLALIRSKLKGPVYGVLGNHDTIRMVPALEEMDIRMLLNESVTIKRNHQRIHLAGIDDAHYYRVENFQKATSGFPYREFSMLLSHTPEIYRQAAHANFDFLMAGHTHGGQICLPGSIPLMLQSVLPRHMAAGPWQYHEMIGYTSVGVGTCIVAARFNCPPEITVHHLEQAQRRPTA
jgi:uncharacterized protein